MGIETDAQREKLTWFMGKETIAQRRKRQISETISRAIDYFFGEKIYPKPDNVVFFDFRKRKRIA